MFPAILDSLPTWNPADTAHAAVMLAGVTIVILVLGAAAILALRNPSYLRKKR